MSTSKSRRERRRQQASSSGNGTAGAAIERAQISAAVDKAEIKRLSHTVRAVDGAGLEREVGMPYPVDDLLDRHRAIMGVAEAHHVDRVLTGYQGPLSPEEIYARAYEDSLQAGEPEPLNENSPPDAAVPAEDSTDGPLPVGEFARRMLIEYDNHLTRQGQPVYPSPGLAQSADWRAYVVAVAGIEATENIARQNDQIIQLLGGLFEIGMMFAQSAGLIQRPAAPPEAPAPPAAPPMPAPPIPSMSFAPARGNPEPELALAGAQAPDPETGEF